MASKGVPPGELLKLAALRTFLPEEDELSGLEEVRCPGVMKNGMRCGSLLCEVSGLVRIVCPKCGHLLVWKTSK